MTPEADFTLKKNGGQHSLARAVFHGQLRRHYQVGAGKTSSTASAS